jgi:hypothetical protein
MPTSSRTGESDLNLRGAALVRGFVCLVLSPFLNERAAPPGVLGSPDKTAQVIDAARIKHMRATANTSAGRPLCYNTGSLAVA